VLKLLRLKFQSVLLQHPETTDVNVTRYWMVELLDHWKRGGASLQQRPNYRLVNTGIGPSAPWVLRGDDLSGDIYQWGWVDALPSDAPSSAA
jgi:hypothetical protein